ncbi:hypothetical protein N1851_006497 [Merluccius polli]|uniref:Uncharacterized protein n=1 Tax=Merluccius polli TaxID=89951 RepID=A0AA47N5T2_MERPO|nr:hypothetical protein N1851_006497 [Merluccius polli]
MAHILTKHKKPFTNGRIVKEAMTAVAETLFKDHKSKTEMMSAIADVQLGANTVARRVSALSVDAVEQLERDMDRTNGIRQNGIRTNGIRQNGIRTNGIRQNGIRTNGIRQNGIRQNGIRQNIVREKTGRYWPAEGARVAEAKALAESSAWKNSEDSQQVSRTFS